MKTFVWVCCLLSTFAAAHAGTYVVPVFGQISGANATYRAGIQISNISKVHTSVSYRFIALAGGSRIGVPCRDFGGGLPWTLGAYETRAFDVLGCADLVALVLVSPQPLFVAANISEHSRTGEVSSQPFVVNDGWIDPDEEATLANLTVDGSHRANVFFVNASPFEILVRASVIRFIRPRDIFDIPTNVSKDFDLTLVPHSLTIWPVPEVNCSVETCTTGYTVVVTAESQFYAAASVVTGVHGEFRVPMTP